MSEMEDRLYRKAEGCGCVSILWEIKYNFPMEIKCEYCNKKFHRGQYQIERAKHHTCSRDCTNALKTKLGIVKKKCFQCGNSVSLKLSQSKNKNFCGYDCHHEFLQTARQNEGNGMWAGDDVGYYALHGWVKRRLPKPKKCQRCKKPKKLLDCANVSGEYKRDLSDWEYLCRKCHMTKDGRLSAMKKDNMKKKRPDRKCKECNISFYPKSTNVIYCSRHCYDFNRGCYGARN